MLGAALLAASACEGKPERPPFAGGAEPTTPPRKPDLVPDEPEPPKLDSPCGAAQSRLELTRPNLYFAIDASGSMLEPIAAGDVEADLGRDLPETRYEALALALERLLERVGHRTSYGATLFPASDGECSDGSEILPLQAGDAVSFALAGEHGPVLKQLMSRIRRRVPRGPTPVAAALEAIAPRLEGSDEPSFVFLLTDGGPNCNESVRCAIESCIPNIERASYAGQVVCDDVQNCCADDWFGSLNCLDSSGSLAAVQALAERGIRTFVIGMPGSQLYAGLLDALAVAGGTAREAPPRYYPAESAAELVEIVTALGLSVGLSCELELLEPPPDPMRVNVYFDGQVVAQDATNGWTWAEENPRTVTLVGEACELLSSGAVLQADVVAGCPVVIR